MNRDDEIELEFLEEAWEDGTWIWNLAAERGPLARAGERFVSRERWIEQARRILSAQLERGHISLYRDDAGGDPTDLALDDIRLGDILQWMRPDREGIFAKLRAERPVSFQEEPVPPPEYDFPQGPGFWALTRYADVMQVSRDPETFHSAPTSTVGDMPAEIAEWLGSMINMDAPKHTKLRLIVNRGFTPRQVARIDDSVREQAKEIVERVAPMGECDFVTEIAAALPLQIICDMMGIPRQDVKQIFELTKSSAVGGMAQRFRSKCRSARWSSATGWCTRRSCVTSPTASRPKRKFKR